MTTELNWWGLQIYTCMVVVSDGCPSSSFPLSDTTGTSAQVQYTLYQTFTPVNELGWGHRGVSVPPPVSRRKILYRLRKEQDQISPRDDDTSNCLQKTRDSTPVVSTILLFILVFTFPLCFTPLTESLECLEMGRVHETEFFTVVVPLGTGSLGPLVRFEEDEETVTYH